MESSQRTIEEVDTMYLTHVPPWKSAKWNLKEVGEPVTTDNLYLSRDGRNINKRTEPKREEVEHYEDPRVVPSRQEGIAEMDRSARPVMSPA